jgi:hypothetical protein
MTSDGKSQWANAVVRVGAGRGFVVGTPDRELFVITAGHCLPELPPCHTASDLAEGTYGALLGPVDEEPTVSAECLFADPIGDIAVLGEPDGQELPDEAKAYRDLVDAAIPVPISKLRPVRTPITLSPDVTILGPPRAESDAWLLSLDGRWFRCEVTVTGRSLWIANASEAIIGGMSGSPILDSGGSAIGVVNVSNGFKTEDGHELGRPREGGPNALLISCLPGWLLLEMGKPMTLDEVEEWEGEKP